MSAQVYHGTCASVAPYIRRDGLQPQGDHGSVFVTTNLEAARKYAWAWTGYSISGEADADDDARYGESAAAQSDDPNYDPWNADEDIVSMYQSMPIGAIVIAEVDRDRLRKDTYNAEGEPDQYDVDGGISTDEIIEIEEFVIEDMVDGGRVQIMAYAYWTSVTRPRRDANYRDAG